MAPTFFEEDAQRQLQASRSQRDREAHRIGKRLEAALGDQSIDQRLLGCGVLGHTGSGPGHAKPFEGRARAVQPGLAGDIGLVEFGGEACRIGEAHQRLPPGSLVRRGDQHAIHIEDRRPQHAPASGRFGSLHCVVRHAVRIPSHGTHSITLAIR